MEESFHAANEGGVTFTSDDARRADVKDMHIMFNDNVARVPLLETSLKHGHVARVPLLETSDSSLHGGKKDVHGAYSSASLGVHMLETSESSAQTCLKDARVQSKLAGKSVYEADMCDDDGSTRTQILDSMCISPRDASMLTDLARDAATRAGIHTSDSRACIDSVGTNASICGVKYQDSDTELGKTRIGAYNNKKDKSSTGKIESLDPLSSYDILTPFAQNIDTVKSRTDSGSLNAHMGTYMDAQSSFPPNRDRTDTGSHAPLRDAYDVRDGCKSSDMHLHGVGNRVMLQAAKHEGDVASCVYPSQRCQHLEGCTRQVCMCACVCVCVYVCMCAGRGELCDPLTEVSASGGVY
jgi:hypothetical protein